MSRERNARRKAREREGWRRRQWWKRNGIVSFTLRANRVWAAEALALAGYGHADSDSRAEIQSKAQEWFDNMIREAKQNVTGVTEDEL